MKIATCCVLAALCSALTSVGWADDEPYTYTKRESTEWFNISIPNATGADLPRVCLIGDSIASRYAGTVSQQLKGKAYVSVLVTSKPVGDPALLDAVRMVLRQNKYDVVHFNNGLHGGWGYTNEDYQKGFPDFVAAIKRHAPDARLIWATTTPCRSEGTTKMVEERNRIAAEVIEKEHVAVDDLFGLVMNRADDPEVLWDGGGVHFTTEGADLQGRHVAKSILAHLPAKP